MVTAYALLTLFLLWELSSWISRNTSLGLWFWLVRRRVGRPSVRR